MAPQAAGAAEPRAVQLRCADGLLLGGHYWAAAQPQGCVIVNAATGVLARYYHRYARFLAGHGFDVLTYDYRGIGTSRPPSLRGCGYRWRDWGELDFQAALDFAGRHGNGPIMVVGHSIGGFLPGLAPGADAVARMLTVGAQYAYWRDYARDARGRQLLKWHLAMPLLTAACGYFPGRRLGWLEDLPAGVANEWAFRRARIEAGYPSGRRADVLARFAAVKAAILAVGMSDDEFGTPAALRRTLDYYSGSAAIQVQLTPQDLGLARVGHFDLFHARHQPGFWVRTLDWLREGRNPWPKHVLHASSP